MIIEARAHVRKIFFWLYDYFFSVDFTMFFETIVLGGFLILVNNGVSIRTASRKLGQIIGKTTTSLRRIKGEAERLQYEAEEKLFSNTKNIINNTNTTTNVSSNPNNPSLSSSHLLFQQEQQQMLTRIQKLKEIRQETVNILTFLPINNNSSSLLSRYTNTNTPNSTDIPSYSSIFTEQEITKALSFSTPSSLPTLSSVSSSSSIPNISPSSTTITTTIPNNNNKYYNTKSTILHSNYNNHSTNLSTTTGSTTIIPPTITSSISQINNVNTTTNNNNTNVKIRSSATDIHTLLELENKYNNSL